MIIDTEKTNCGNCQYYEVYKTSQEIKDILLNPGVLYACNGVKGFGIIGPTFYYTTHTLRKK